MLTPGAAVAAAQPPAAPPPGQGMAVPPPVDLSALPSGSGKPDKTYEKKTECVTRSLGENIIPKEIPWGQQYLRLDDVHRLMQAETGGIGIDPQTKQPIRVAVIDTGVHNHPWFGHPVQGGGDYVKEENRGLEDCDGHGTEVAGIIGAKTPNDVGFRGVAPDSQIVSIRQSSQNYQEAEKTSSPAAPPPSSSGAPPSSSGGAPPSSSSEAPPEEGGGAQPGGDGTEPGQQGGGRQIEDNGTAAGTVGTLAHSVRTAADTEGVKVINMSVDNCRKASGGPRTASESELQAAVRYAVEQKNIVVVAAAGNTSEACPQNNQPDPNQPISIVNPPWFRDDVLSVAAIDQTGSVAQFSVNGPWVSVAAPGTKIISLDPAPGSTPSLANLTIEGGKPQEIQGTSFAAPYVAGLAVLVRAKFPHLNARQVMARIMQTAQHPGAHGGRDQFVGYGMINPMAALTAALPSEQGFPPAQNMTIPSDLPPADNTDDTPMIVALAGAGGGLVILLITMFVMHTLRRNDPERSA
ncbi:type VII secretion-associated serine protease mycosin [Amycolatopsis suaedae]|uniref:Type VII secretion-associated serine protease mycosin n=2 Tax=Amycolatopsis suaedae TaxID=2510978 RepID=A0A4Q7JBR4_9PSEU|nr:type VII secretion-associated serine protease mycosin [Amycolatopsis suaedae]